MTELQNPALLPGGLRDVLPPDAAFEASVIETLIACFSSHGYQRVRTPMVEFEDGLLSGPGASMSSETFRLMDPLSQRMMGVRADITPQIARIAATRLKGAPRPLRLSYAGEVMRVRGTQLRPERQIGQVGVELIGAHTARADAEVVLLAAEALAAIGVPGISVDLTIPLLVPSVIAGLTLDEDDSRALRAALDRKDAAAVAALAGPMAKPLAALLEAGGPAAGAVTALARLDLPAAAASERARLTEVVEIISARAPDLTLTVDPVENRGFAYQNGISFTIFHPGMREELGVGGRYVVENGAAEAVEPATGVTLYMYAITRVLPEPRAEPSVYLPVETPGEDGRRLRAEGWRTVAGLVSVPDDLAEARRLGCSHLLQGGTVVEVATVKEAAGT